MINRAPKIMLGAVDTNEDFIDMPAPERIRPMVDASFADLNSEQRPKAVSPETDGLMADINAPFEQDVFNLAKRKRIANVHHDRETDYLGRTIEAAERISHLRTLRSDAQPLKSDYSDSAGL
jgi:hypothetical protein